MSGCIGIVESNALRDDSQADSLLHLFTDPEGMDIFEEYVVPFLTVQEVVECSRTGRSWHRRCRTYTIPELLSARNQSLSTRHKSELRRAAFKEVRSYSVGIRPTRFVMPTQFQFYYAKLYHKEELQQLNQIIDRFLEMYGTNDYTSNGCENSTTEIKSPDRHEAESPILLSAWFGPFPAGEGGLDVTKQVERIISRHGGRLVLVPPVSLAQNRKPSCLPSTIAWWYTRLFGDPTPGVRKALSLRVVKAAGSEEKTILLKENQIVTLKLRTHKTEPSDR